MFRKWLELHNFKIFNFFLYRSNITDILQIFEQHLQTMADGWRSEPKVQPLFYGLLVTLYACLITVGATGNLLVILVRIGLINFCDRMALVGYQFTYPFIISKIRFNITFNCF